MLRYSSKASTKRCRLASWVILICCCGTTSIKLLEAQSNSDVISKINQAERDREEKLAGYNVTEHYRIFEPGNDGPVGEAQYAVNYVRGHGKSYRLVSERFSKPFVKPALARIIKKQESLSQPALRIKVLPTSDNYVMALIDEGKEPRPSYICDVNRPSRKTRLLAIKPLHSSPGLIEGFMWVDSANYHVVRIEGRFSESPNILVGRPTFERDYVDLNGFAVAKSSCQVAQSPVSHHREQILYEDYQFLP